LNPGAANVRRTLGLKYGAVVLLLDASKGSLSVFISRYFDIPEHNLIFCALGGILSIAGHILTPFLGFKGGKGVATTLGVFLVISPIPMLISAGFFLVVYKLSGYVSLGSILAAFFLPVSYILINLGNEFTTDFYFVAGMMGLVFLLILIRHTSNIKRMIQGKELKIN
ncbi:MAG: glycerol-3-phosphate acyltransferase, partial [Leptospira sp.]|nr:glycerol-3-phosphate acyltransferase [Leptospira sp.]